MEIVKKIKFTGLGRAEGETFEEYKQRRHESNLARDAINRRAGGGGLSSRTQLREAQKKNPSYHGGTYGKNLIAMFAARRPDLAVLQAKHKAYLEAKLKKAAERALFNKELQLKAA